MYGVRRDAAMLPEVRAAVTPRTQADRPVGELNRYEITVRKGAVSVVLPGMEIPGLPARGRIGLQHHGGEKNGQWKQPARPAPVPEHLHQGIESVEG